MVLRSDLRNKIKELRGKTLGCFCDQSGLCHAKVLKELVEYYEIHGKLPKSKLNIKESWNPKTTGPTKEICRAQTQKKERCKSRAKENGLCGRHKNSDPVY